MTVLEVALMTGLKFAGGSEFAAVGLWTNPLPVALIVGMTFLINSRHLLMSAALVPFLDRLPRRVVFPALFFMVDENWAMSLADARKRQVRGDSAAQRDEPRAGPAARPRDATGLDPETSSG